MTPITIREAASLLRSGELTSVELTQQAHGIADERDGDIGVFVTRTVESSLEAARRADDELGQGLDRGPLHGIPIGIKDNIATNDAPTTGQSKVRFEIGEGDATVVARLRNAGAVVVGKTTTMEFANGLPDASMPFPMPRNPFDLERWAGGSSSGSASGVMSAMFLGGVGTDTGGSIRAPAAYCGVTGLKPTFGRVPKSGCIPNGYTLDHVGPIARTAWDCAAMLQVMAGHDRQDPTSAQLAVANYCDGLSSPTPLRLAINRRDHAELESVETDVRDTYEASLEVFRCVGAELVEIELPMWDSLKAAFSLTSMVEKFSIHHRMLSQSWHEYGRNTRFSAGQGALVSGSDYLKAQRVRRIGLSAILDALAPFDALVVPTMGKSAPLLSSLTFESLMGGSPTFTSVWNFLGFPAIAFPAGFDRNRLPVSVQAVAKPFDELAALRVADLYQRHTNWHEVVPQAT